MGTGAPKRSKLAQIERLRKPILDLLVISPVVDDGTDPKDRHRCFRCRMAFRDDRRCVNHQRPKHKNVNQPDPLSFDDLI